MNLTTYKLPGPVVMALTTGRPELLSGSVPFDAGTQLELLRLLRDLIIDREQAKVIALAHEATLKMVAQTLHGLEGTLERLESAP